MLDEVTPTSQPTMGRWGRWHSFPDWWACPTTKAVIKLPISVQKAAKFSEYIVFTPNILAKGGKIRLKWNQHSVLEPILWNLKNFRKNHKI